MDEFIYCSHCGNQVLKEAEICPKCGCRVSSHNVVEAMMKEKTRQSEIDFYGYMSLISAIFLGFIGLLIFGCISKNKLQTLCKTLGIESKDISKYMSASAKVCLYIASLLCALEIVAVIILILGKIFKVF